MYTHYDTRISSPTLYSYAWYFSQTIAGDTLSGWLAGLCLCFAFALCFPLAKAFKQSSSQ